MMRWVFVDSRHPAAEAPFETMDLAFMVMGCVPAGQ
jgi:hypothetical protein